MQKNTSIFLKILPIFLVITLIISNSSRLLTTYANFFSINNYEKGAGAIIILGGSADTRAKKGIELLKNGYSNRLLITKPASPIREYSEIMVDDFVNLKTILKHENIDFEIVEDINNGAKSTFDEARDLVFYLRKNNMKRIIIVTDSFHTRRAKYAIDKVFKIYNCNVIVQIAGAKNQIYDETNWWKTERGLNAYISEIFKYVFYLANDDNIDGIKTE